MSKKLVEGAAQAIKVELSFSYGARDTDARRLHAPRYKVVDPQDGFRVVHIRASAVAISTARSFRVLPAMLSGMRSGFHWPRFELQCGTMGYGLRICHPFGLFPLHVELSGGILKWPVQGDKPQSLCMHNAQNERQLLVRSGVPVRVQGRKRAETPLSCPSAPRISRCATHAQKMPASPLTTPNHIKGGPKTHSCNTGSA